MKIAFVHYHLEPGGVTSVITVESQTLAVPHVILHGGGGHPPGLQVRQIEGLGYLKDTHLTADQLLENIRSAAAEALGGPPDVWHFHNPTLGKNPLFPRLIRLMSEAGDRLVLHLHDLMEDGRPGNHRDPYYPVSPNIVYAFINSRDRQRFVDAGLPEDQAVLLPNPVQPRSGKAAPLRRDEGAPLLFAPIRGIRRKNLGELVLLASLLPSPARIAISRAPENPQWLGIHDDWRHFAGEHALPIDFGVVSEEHPFGQWLEKATHFITTSIAEGFGLPFLNSLVHQKPLIGRDLPHLSSDQGFPTEGLYQKILVPCAWLNMTRLTQELRRMLTATWRAYGHPLPPAACERALAAMKCGEYLDFGNLPESFQREIILHPLRDALLVMVNGRTSLLKEWLAETLELPAPEEDLPERFTPQAHTEALMKIYQRTGRDHHAPLLYLEPQKILTAYLSPENFHFLRASTPAIRAIIFDLYGTLLLAPPGAVRPNPTADPELRQILINHGHPAPDSPSQLLHAAVVRHHAASTAEFPEIDLRRLWREILGLSEETDIAPMITAIEDAWHPARLMPGAAEMLDQLPALPLGILSNAQHHSLQALGKYANLFSADLTILSYQHGIAKPSPQLFTLLRERLEKRGIAPENVLYIGNDPVQDILPAAAIGFQTALFTGHPDSLRPGICEPDITLENWHELAHFTPRTAS